MTTIDRFFYDKNWEPVDKWEQAQFVTFSAATGSPEESDLMEKKCLRRAKTWARQHKCTRVTLEMRSSVESDDVYNDAVGVIVER